MYSTSATISQQILHILSSLSLIVFGQYFLIITLRAGIPLFLERFIQKTTASPLRSFLLSALVTGFLQLGNVTILISMVLVEVGLISSSQGIILMLGGMLGIMTETWKNLFIRETLAPILLVLSLMWLIASRGTTSVRYGQILFSVAIMMLGLSLTTEFLMPFHELLLKSSSFSLIDVTSIVGALHATAVGAALAALFQGSSVIVDITLVLSQTKMISIEQGIALLLGSNIGSTVLPLVMCILLHNKPAKKIAYAYLLTYLQTGFLVILFYKSYLSLVITLTSWLGFSKSPLATISVGFSLFVILNSVIWYILRDILTSMVRGIRKKTAISTVALSDLVLALPEYIREFYLECAEHLESSIRETRYILDYLMNSIEKNEQLDWRAYQRAKDLLSSVLHHAENSLNALSIYMKQSPAQPISLTLFAKHLSTIESVLGTVQNIERQIQRLGEPFEQIDESELARIRHEYQSALTEMFNSLHEEHLKLEHGSIYHEGSENILLLRLSTYFKGVTCLIRSSHS
jgi:Na+/phosphate symporter